MVFVSILWLSWFWPGIHKSWIKQDIAWGECEGVCLEMKWRQRRNAWTGYYGEKQGCWREDARVGGGRESEEETMRRSWKQTSSLRSLLNNMDRLVRRKGNSRMGARWEDGPMGSAEKCIWPEAGDQGCWGGKYQPQPAQQQLTQGCKCLMRLKGEKRGERSGSLIYWCCNQMEPEEGCFWSKYKDWQGGSWLPRCQRQGFHLIQRRMLDN